MSNTINKTRAVEKHLERYGKIDTWTAIQRYRATRLASIIYNLKKEGRVIHSEQMHDEGENWVEYRLHEGKKYRCEECGAFFYWSDIEEDGLLETLETISTDEGVKKDGFYTVEYITCPCCGHEGRYVGGYEGENDPDGEYAERMREYWRSR